jgi:DNA-binding response OmpR family regulator
LSSQSTTDAAQPVETVTILVYSDDANIREKVKLAVGRRPAPDVPRVEYVETATPFGTVSRVDQGGIALCILDGEAVPAGGMGVCRQLKDEVYRCPPVLVLIGREQDRWLADWSRADGVSTHPIDPMTLAGTVARMLRERATKQAGAAAARAAIAGH